MLAFPQSPKEVPKEVRSSHCQWCQITPKEVGVPAHPTTSGRMVSVPVSGTCSTVRVRYDVGGGGRLQMEWNTCTYSYNLLERLNVSRNVQPRHFLIELFQREIDIVVVSPEAGMIAELKEVCGQEDEQHQSLKAKLNWQLINPEDNF